MNEATASLRINRLLEEAGWRFVPEGAEPAGDHQPAARPRRPNLLGGTKNEAQASLTMNRTQEGVRW